MPRGDGTGPEGKGPLTGRGAGACGGNDVAGVESAGRGSGRDRRFRRGVGRARRNRFGGRGLPGRVLFGWGTGAAAAKEEPDAGSDS